MLRRELWSDLVPQCPASLMEGRCYQADESRITEIRGYDLVRAVHFEFDLFGGLAQGRKVGLLVKPD